MRETKLTATMTDLPAETEYSALQALMQIRTNSADGATTTGESGNNPSIGNAAPATANVGQGVSNVNPTSTEIANLVRINAYPAALLQQAQLAYNPAQLAAIRAAAAARGGLILQQFPATGLRSPFHAATVLAAATVATAPSLPQSPGLSPLRPGAALPQGGVIIPTVTGLTKHDEAEATEKKIRKGEVEAALRSKPQRGRKRENLNAEERLELTRTRNREHAKSTR